MARGGLHETAKTTVLMNGKQAAQEIDRLGKKADEFKKKRQDAFEKGNTAAVKKYDRELKRIGKSMEGLRDESEMVESVLKDINGASLNKITRTLRSLRKQMNNMSPKDPGFKKLAEQASLLDKRQGELIRSSRRLRKEAGGLKGVFANLLPVLSITAAVAGIKQLFTNVIRVRQEFEKYEAVLRISLGSQKAASREMNMLKQFAAETPFALQELTNSYVKLTNYGLKPTREELTKYGDVAASIGKSFDQYVEAIADAVTFEFERLKEFGIKAKKEGDKITFTFKEQTTVVDANSQAIKAYMASLGELEGVQGSMAAISETLGGRISNMGDAWDSLLDTIGGGTSGIFITAINWITKLINALTFGLRTIEDIKAEVMQNIAAEGMQNAIKEINIISASLIRNGVDVQTAQKRAAELYNQQMQNSINAAKEKIKTAEGAEKEGLQKRIDIMTEEVLAVKTHNEQLEAQALIRQKKEEERRKKEAFEIKKQKNDIYKSLQGSDPYQYYMSTDEAMIQQFSMPDEELPDFDPMKAMDGLLDQQQAALKKQYADGIIDQQTYNALKEDLEIAHMLTMLEIRKQLGEDTADIENQLLDKQFENQVNANAKEIELLQLKKEVAIDSAQQISEAVFAIKQNQLNAEVDAKLTALEKEREAELANDNLTEEQKAEIKEKYAKKEAAVKLSAWKKEKKAAITQAIINGALAITKIYATIPPPVSFAMVAPQAVATAAQIAVIASQKPPEFYTGGYTSRSASDSEPAGIVHANEFVANRYATKNPTVRPVLDMIDYAQRNGNISNLNLPAMIKSGGYKSGGYVQPAGSTPASATPVDYTQLINAMNRFEAVVLRLESEGISGKWIYQDFKNMQQKEETAINKTA